MIVESRSDFAGKSSTNQYFSDCRSVENIHLCILAFIATPQAASALDVKIARSYEDTVIRRQLVDLLTDIYRRLATRYGVNNYVAIGTNQILKLAYTPSQELTKGVGNSAESLKVGLASPLTNATSFYPFSSRLPFDLNGDKLHSVHWPVAP